MIHEAWGMIHEARDDARVEVGHNLSDMPPASRHPFCVMQRRGHTKLDVGGVDADRRSRTFYLCRAGPSSIHPSERIIL